MILMLKIKLILSNMLNKSFSSVNLNLSKFFTLSFQKMCHKELKTSTFSIQNLNKVTVDFFLKTTMDRIFYVFHID